MKGKPHRIIPDTCGSCAHYVKADKLGGCCHCWKVKGKGGNYAKRSHNTTACEHYVSRYASWAPISY